MANRRKFIAGLGALATGSAAAMGTGAFTSVTADRSVNVNTADDASALLSLDAVSSLSNSVYADETNNSISIDLNNTDLNGGSNSGSPTGVNGNATTKILDIFQVKNQGTQNVLVYVDPDDITPNIVKENDSGTEDVFIDPQASGLPHQTSYKGSPLSLTSVGLDDQEIADYSRDDFPAEAGYYEPQDLTLEPGESFDFGLHIEINQDDWDGTVNLPISANADHAVTEGDASSPTDW